MRLFSSDCIYIYIFFGVFIYIYIVFFWRFLFQDQLLGDGIRAPQAKEGPHETMSEAHCHRSTVHHVSLRWHDSTRIVFCGSCSMFLLCRRSITLHPHESARKCLSHGDGLLLVDPFPRDQGHRRSVCPRFDSEQKSSEKNSVAENFAK